MKITKEVKIVKEVKILKESKRSHWPLNGLWRFACGDVSPQWPVVFSAHVLPICLPHQVLVLLLLVLVLVIPICLPNYVSIQASCLWPEIFLSSLQYVVFSMMK